MINANKEDTSEPEETHFLQQAAGRLPPNSVGDYL